MRGTWRRALGAYLLALCLCLSLLPTAALAEAGEPGSVDPDPPPEPQTPVDYIVYTWNGETGLSKTTEELAPGEYTEINSANKPALWGEN